MGLTQTLADPAIPGVSWSYNAGETMTIKDGSNFPVMKDVQVTLIYWGANWNNPTGQNPPTKADCDRRVQSLFDWGFMSALNQYHGINNGKIAASLVDANTPLPTIRTIRDPDHPRQFITSQYVDETDCSACLTALLDSGTIKVNDAHNDLFALFLPTSHDVRSGTKKNLAVGFHSSFVYKGKLLCYCLTGDNNSSNYGIIEVFSHELAEACTDPYGSGIRFRKKDSQGTIISDANNEVSDINSYDIIEQFGDFYIQGYWSVQHNKHVIPIKPTQPYQIRLDKEQKSVDTDSGIYRQQINCPDNQQQTITVHWTLETINSNYTLQINNPVVSCIWKVNGDLIQGTSRLELPGNHWHVQPRSIRDLPDVNRLVSLDSTVLVTIEQSMTNHIAALLIKPDNPSNFRFTVEATATLFDGSTVNLAKEVLIKGQLYTDDYFAQLFNNSCLGPFIPSDPNLHPHQVVFPTGALFNLDLINIIDEISHNLSTGGLVSTELKNQLQQIIAVTRLPTQSGF